MAARKNKLYLTETWKERIQLSMLINRLQDHAHGKCDMSATQVRAAEVLLRKVAPDLASTESTVTHKTSYADVLSRISEQDHGVTPQVGPAGDYPNTDHVTH